LLPGWLEFELVALAQAPPLGLAPRYRERDLVATLSIPSNGLREDLSFATIESSKALRRAE